MLFSPKAFRTHLKSIYYLRYKVNFKEKLNQLCLLMSLRLLKIYLSYKQLLLQSLGLVIKLKDKEKTDVP